jgi:serine/threonine-protein kinase ULK/ATG1
VRHFLKQLASALEFLRKDGLVHRDVKPQNLLLNPPPDYEVQFGDEGNMEGSRILVGLSTLPVLKLADFGFARVLPSTAMAETLCGSPLYMAPEILRYEKYDATADLWSVGTVLYEMMTGKPPFRAPNHVDLLRKIESRNDRIDFPSSCNSSEELRGLVRSLLKRNPVERMSFEEFFKHPVITADIPGVRVPRVEPVVEARRVELPLRTESGEMRNSPPARRPLVEARRSSVDTERNSPRGLSSSPRGKARIENSALPFATTTDDNQAGVPSRPADVRRYTTQTGVRQQTSTRPGMPVHSTAPAREDLISQRRNAVPMERVQSRESNPSPGASLMMQQREQEREQQESKERRPNARRGTNSRELRDDDYVIVDKQQVQVNALADEIAISRRREVTPPSSANALVRRLSSAGAQRTSPRQVAARAAEHVHTISSYERNYGSSPGTSAKSALAKALDIANLRLFGGSLSPPNHSPPNMAAQFPPYASPGSLVVAGNNGNMLEEDLRTIYSIEESASRSDVVYSFAEVKYAQVMPSASLPPQSHGLGLVSTGSTQAFDAPSEGLNSELTPDATILAAEECLVLFVKVLSILSKATDVAHAWWAASGEPMLPARIAASSRMNNVVQWIRERFNEVLEKAEAVQGRIMDAQKDLPPNHPNRPSNAQSDISLGSAGNNFMLTTGVTAEKLMYDRALEMSRASAVNELVGDDLPGCEIAYVTSLRLLEAVLERRDDDDHYLHDDDRKAIEKCKLSVIGIKAPR